MRRINPVFLSGVKTRMRGVRAPVLMSVYFAILLGIYALVYMTLGGDNYYDVARPRPDGMELLTVLYSLLVCVIYGIVVLLVPALNAGNISSEREKQTLDLLLSSRLSGISIVMGKVLSNLVFVVFLLTLALPLFAVTYLFGSIMILDVLKAFFYMIVTAYACASVSTFYSALMKKTIVATILTYVTQWLFIMLTTSVGAYMMFRYYENVSVYGSLSQTYIPFVLRINPGPSIIELLAVAESNSNAGTDFLGGFFDEIGGGGFLLWSGSFLVFVSVIFNIFSAVLIKPVQKFQLSASNPKPAPNETASGDPAENSPESVRQEESAPEAPAASKENPPS